MNFETKKIWNVSKHSRVDICYNYDMCCIYIWNWIWNPAIYTLHISYSHLLSSRLYCRPRNLTESCLAARGLYHR